MNKLTRILLSVTLLLVCTLAVLAQGQLAFPGAEGFGRFTTGGRGGKVYHVTTLEDNGKTSLVGSLRWANAQSGPRTIVFDVSGTIMLKSALAINSNTTIAGQTAPGDGICIANYPVTLKSNVIVRYVRFRLGNEALKTNPSAHEGDGLGAMDQKNIIVDHCSVSWSIDECLSVYGSTDITVQWCISAQSLVNAGHSKGSHGYGGNWGGSGASYHHNLMIHHTSRTPRLGPRPGTQEDERMDLRNNVIYNWGGNGCYGGEGMNVNIVNNYYKPGPGTLKSSEGIQQRIAGIGIRTTEYTHHGTSDANQWDVMWHVWGKFFVNGNVNSLHDVVTQDNWTYGIYNQIRQQDVDNTFNDQVKKDMHLDEPIAFLATTTHSAEKAYEQVLKYVGASLHRDQLDEIMVSDAQNGTATFTGSGNNPGFINSQDDVKSKIPNGWPELQQGTAKPDTDGDGMPDEWEDAHGLDKNNKADGNAIGEGGYTNLEIYLNSIVADITAAQNEGGTLMGTTMPGEAQAVTYTLDNTTYQETAGGIWQFADGLGISGGENYSEGSQLNTFRVEKNTLYTILLPEGVTIAEATFAGYCEATGTNTSKLIEVNGEECSFNFPNRSKGETASHTVSLSTPATGQLTFKVGSNRTALAITLTGTKGGTTDIINVNVNDDENWNGNVNDNYYTLQGTRVSHPTNGIYIHNRRKVIVKD